MRQFALGEDVFVEDFVLVVDRRQGGDFRSCFRAGRLFRLLHHGDGRRLGGRWLFRHQARLQLAGKIADLVLQGGARGGVVRVAQPNPQLQQRRGDLPAETQAEDEGEQQQDQAQQPHALQADGHRLLELLHVEADAQVAGDHFLEGDRRRVEPFRLAEQALLGPAAGLREDAVVHAVDSRMGDQPVLGEIAEQHIEAEDVIRHQQFGGRRRGLGHQALAEFVGLLLHGVLELHAHHPGVDHHRRSQQQQAVDGDAQGDRYTTLAQGVEQQEEEIVGLDGGGPGHSGLGLC
ncbi:hypothetical protein D3C76_757750 [compost metagenome]